MNRKNLFLLIVVITGALAIMSGCMVPQVGAPGPSTAISGRVATPESCFTDACDNPSITEGKPLPEAIALFYGGDSGKLEIEGETECNGAFEVNTTEERSYVLYVVREHPEGSGNYVVVKKGINNPRGDVGEANVYTTSQVIIWERANALYGEDFVPFNASWYAQYGWKWSFDPDKLVLPVSEIPNLEPTKQLIDAVEKALSECRDPQEDNKVIHFADKIANATFGAPGGGGAAGGGGGGGVTPAPADEEGEDGGGGGEGGGGGGAANRSFTVTKSANPTTAKVGDTITYTVTVKNTGNSPLTGVAISDTLVTGTLTLTSGDTDSDRILDTDETWVYTYTYTVQSGDAGKTIRNVVTVNANGVALRSAYADVTVNEVCVPPTAAFTADPISGDAPLTVQFTNGSTGTDLSYSWDFDGDGTEDSTAKDPSYTYENSGDYTVTLKVSGKCGDDTETTTINVTEGEVCVSPTAAFTAFPTFGYAPLEVTFTNESTGTNLSYSWDFGDGDSSTDVSPSHTYTTSGTYTVTLTVTGDCGEGSSATRTIKVTKPCCNYSISKNGLNANWGSPGGRGIHLHAKINGGGCTRETTLKVGIYHNDVYITTQSYTVTTFGQNQEWQVYTIGESENKKNWKLKIWLETSGCSPTEPIELKVKGGGN